MSAAHCAQQYFILQEVSSGLLVSSKRERESSVTQAASSQRDPQLLLAQEPEETCEQFRLYQKYCRPPISYHRCFKSRAEIWAVFIENSNLT